MRRPQKATRPASTSAGKHVLIVEADPEAQVDLAHALRSQGHYVVAASSAAGALALTTQFAVDLVLVSQELPRTTGIDVAVALGAARPDLPVLVVTNEGSPGLRAAARRAGARGCVTLHDVASQLDALLHGDRPAHATHEALGAALDVAAQSAE